MPALRCGADRLGEYKHLFKDARVGLVTTPTGRTSDGRSTIAALQQAADLRVLLGPEHGVRGDGAAGAFIPQYTDAATGLPVFSLYGKDSKRLTPAMLETFDVLDTLAALLFIPLWYAIQHTHTDAEFLKGYLRSFLSVFLQSPKRQAVQRGFLALSGCKVQEVLPCPPSHSADKPADQCYRDKEIQFFPHL